MHNTPQIFIINLKQDTEKKDHMQELCKTHSLDCQFIDAIYGPALDEQYIQEILDKEKGGRELSAGEIGCTLSHISIYQKMVDQNIENAIIFEDDIDLKKDFTTLLNSIEKFPKDWEIILLGYHSQEYGSPEAVQTKANFRFKHNIIDRFKVVRLAQLAYGTYGYMINKKGAQKLLNELTLMAKPIDHYTGVDTYANMYAIQPRVVKISEKFNNQSNIELERDMFIGGITLKKIIARFLYKIGLLNIIRNSYILRKRFKKLKKYI